MSASSFDVEPHFAHAGNEYCAQVKIRDRASRPSAVREVHIVFRAQHSTAAAALAQAGEFARWVKTNPDRYQPLFDSNLA